MLLQAEEINEVMQDATTFEMYAQLIPAILEATRYQGKTSLLYEVKTPEIQRIVAILKDMGYTVIQANGSEIVIDWKNPIIHH
nr:MAG TPA: hypothetical protein [Caudoviricetes sp.]